MTEILAKASTEARPFEILDISADIAQARERCAVDFNFFAMCMIPEVMEHLFPEFYIGIFNLLRTRSPKQIGRILRFALGLPRGHAKTTFIKLLICWLIVHDKVSFVAVICASDDLAEALVSDIDDMLSSENSEALFGYWSRQKILDNKTEKSALFRERNVILVARGEGSSIRGINRKHKRPDLIFFDDAQTKECDDSEVESLKFRKRFVATMKIISPRGNRLIIYVGNMYSENCMLFQLKKSASWISLITGAIKENGEPLWPELHPLEELMESYIHDCELGEEEVWFAEVMNDPVSKVTSLINDSLPKYEQDEETLVPDGVFLTIDPAGFRKTSDDNVIIVHYVYDGKGVIREIDAGIKDPEQLIIRALELAIGHGASCIGVEETGYQQTLLFWLEKHIRELGIKGIEIVPLKPSGRAKEARIRLFVAELYAGNYALWSSARIQFIWQALKFKIGKKDNKDDILDGCAYGLDMRTQYWHLIRNMKTEYRYQLPSAVVENNTPF